MLEVVATIEGLEELEQGLAEMPEVLGSETEQAIDQLLLLAQGRLATYPAQAMGTRYRRTGLLGQMWAGATHRVRRVSLPGGRMYVEGSVRNARPGVAYVQDEGSQAEVHVGRWQTAQQVMAELQPEADQLLERAGERAVGQAATAPRG